MVQSLVQSYCKPTPHCLGPVVFFSSFSLNTKEDCSFTDPTLSFSGLSTYKRNVGSLQGVLDKLVRNSSSELYSCSLQQVPHVQRGIYSTKIAWHSLETRAAGQFDFCNCLQLVSDGGWWAVRSHTAAGVQ